jgi:peptide deformylase
MPKKILQKDSKLLREFSKEVSLKDIGSLKVKKVISDMKSALESQNDGVAIAAPQVGHLLRIFIVSKRVKEIVNKIKKPPGEELNNKNVIEENKDLVFINPVVKKLSKSTAVLEEGCLSVRYLYGKVKRSKQATIEAYNEEGGKITRGAGGLMAQIFQHEIDHLNGILFIDKAKDLVEAPPENIKND